MRETAEFNRHFQDLTERLDRYLQKILFFPSFSHILSFQDEEWVGQQGGYGQDSERGDLPLGEGGWRQCWRCQSSGDGSISAGATSSKVMRESVAPQLLISFFVVGLSGMHSGNIYSQKYQKFGKANLTVWYILSSIVYRTVKVYLWTSNENLKIRIYKIAFWCSKIWTIFIQHNE